MNSLLADVLVGVHLCVVLFMLLGFLGIAVGALRRWEWIRNPWFRLPHLAILAYVILSSVRNELCFLTVWEAQLRREDGAEGSAEVSFVGRFLREAVFVDLDQLWLHRLYYSAGVLALILMLCAPPRLRSPRR